MNQTTRDQCYSMAYGGVGITSTSDFEVTFTGTMAYDGPAHEGMGASLGVDIETILGPFSFQASATHEGVGEGQNVSAETRNVRPRRQSGCSAGWRARGPSPVCLHGTGMDVSPESAGRP